MGTAHAGEWHYTAGTAAVLDPSKVSGASAQLDLVKPPAPATAEAPTLTASSACAGDPRWVIEFHNGDRLFGELPDGTTAQSALSWTLEPAGTAEPSWAAALAAADAGGAGYWEGLAAGHTYDIELIPAGANRQPLPHAQIGWINIVTTG
jgi:hypothetical protein